MEQNVTREKRQDAKPQKISQYSGPSKSPRKRRKVNHACVYCRRSHMTCDLGRPCARCIKRNIGHLCHDEPREPDTASSKKFNCLQNSSSIDDDGPFQSQVQGKINNGMSSSFESPQDLPQDSLSIGPPVLPQVSLQIIQPSSATEIQTNVDNDRNNQYIAYSNDWSRSQSNPFHEMHNYHPSYMFNAPEVTTECNLLNDFLNNSLLDDGALLPGDIANLYNDQLGCMLPSSMGNHVDSIGSQLSGPLTTGNIGSNPISRPASVIPMDKAREYYLQAADPTGNDAPEERMQRLLQAKYDAGMLKPFNYVKGYARLSAYMDGHLQSVQKLKILRQLERFRPKFREKVQALTDIELIYVEMWFERSLMECDRVFASMAIPACCWRRTGEIFRGNKEMAELIHVPIENLRDGKISLHEILAEESLVNYWEKFGAIAFDQGQKALLTSCLLKTPDENLKDSSIKCCFSFNIKRDDHKMQVHSTSFVLVLTNTSPSLIIGNFLPQDPVKH